MEGQLDTFNAAGFMVAQQIYSSGGHSKSFAELTLASPLTDAIPSGTVITGTDAEGGTVPGEAYEDAAAASTTLKFRYDVSSSQATYSNCQVGGLIETNTDGCTYRFTWRSTRYLVCTFPTHHHSFLCCHCHRVGLSSNGTLTIGSLSGVAYTYDVATNNDNGRTLQGFSTGANKKMRHDEDETKDFYPDFQKV